MLARMFKRSCGCLAGLAALLVAAGVTLAGVQQSYAIAPPQVGGGIRRAGGLPAARTFRIDPAGLSAAGPSVAALVSALQAQALTMPDVTIDTPAADTVVLSLAPLTLSSVQAIATMLQFRAGLLVEQNAQQRETYFALSRGLRSGVIATELPRIGPWIVRIIGGTPPPGAVPAGLAGQALAYDAAHYDAPAVRIEFSLAPPARSRRR